MCKGYSESKIFNDSNDIDNNYGKVSSALLHLISEAVRVRIK